MSAYYNEIDRYCCDWLQNLMDAGHITPGKVDDRSIADLSPDDVRGYERVHFFAGIAGWELALNLAGWGDGFVWSGSCPCQPFSAAGKGKASSDERHLWPEWFRLIRAVRPPVIFGEQVEAAIGWGWLDLVHSDLEAEGYTVGAAVLPACSVGAPHIRQRLWFVANTVRGRAIDASRQGLGAEAEVDGQDGNISWERLRPRIQGATGELADADGGHPSTEGLQRSGEHGREPQDGGSSLLADSLPARRPQGRARTGNGQTAGGGGDSRWMDNPAGQGFQERAEQEIFGEGPRTLAQRSGNSGPWSNLIWLPCTDGKQRPTGKLVYPEGKQVGVPGCTWEPRKANGEGPTQSIIQPLVAGLSVCLARLRAIEDEAFREIIAYGTHTQADPDKVLLGVRESLRAQACGQAAGIGMCQQFHAAEILLDCLLSQLPARQRGADSGGIAEASHEAQHRIVRSLRAGYGNGCASCGLRADEQHGDQSANSLHLLSLILARHAQAYWQEAINAHAADGRVGKLRAAGNSIVPQVAAEFIKASMT